jgi:hypothetical protein
VSKGNNIMMIDGKKVAAHVVRNLITLATLTLLLHSAAFAAPNETQPSPSELKVNALVAEAGGDVERKRLPKDGGAPALVLRAYLAALNSRDWNAMQALSPAEISDMMEEDEADGFHLKLLDGMRQGAPAKIDILEGWFVVDTIAFISYQGRGADRKSHGTAELLIEDGEWKVTMLGLEK